MNDHIEFGFDHSDYSKVKGKIRLGLCCINSTIRKTKTGKITTEIFCSRSCTRKSFNVELAKKLALQNVKDISTMILWNEQHNIKCFRLSSDIFPHFTDDETEKYTIDFCKEELKKAGDLAKQLGHRILMHPSQFNQIASPNIKVFQKTIDDLSHHADILDYMGIDMNGVLIVHGGGVFGDKEETKKRWIERFPLLPEKVRRRLVLENCERCYNVRDCLDIVKEINIPLVFDCHHYECFKMISGEKEHITDLLKEVIKSWSKRRILMHISEQRPESRIGAHSDFIENIPDYMLSVIEDEEIEYDLEVEAKAKELAIFKLYDKYPGIFK